MNLSFKAPSAFRIVPLLGLCGCLHTVASDPLPKTPLPGSFVEARDEDEGGEPPNEPWWLAFNNATLSGLIERALGDSLKLRAAWARLAQADALARQGQSGLYPSLNLSGSASSQERFLSFRGQNISTDEGGVSLGLDYEVDVWGRMTSLAKSTTREQQAVRDELEWTAMGLTTSIAESWFSLTSLRAQQRVLQAQLETNEAMLELVTSRFRQGTAPALDVHQQAQQVTTTRAQLVASQAQSTVTAHGLAVLLGAPPGRAEIPDGEDLPSLPALPATGIPARLLDARPDVRRARRLVEAADHRVNVALADLLPALRLSGSVGFAGTNFADLVSNMVWSVVGNVVAPLFEGGRRTAEVDRARALVEERMSSYGDTVLQALLEVENALVQEKLTKKRMQALEDQLQHTRRALQEAKSRYLQGLSDYLPVMTALRAHQGTQLSLLVAENSLYDFRVQLCRALGGGWTQRLVRDPDNDGGAKVAPSKPSTSKRIVGEAKNGERL